MQLTATTPQTMTARRTLNKCRYRRLHRLLFPTACSLLLYTLLILSLLTSALHEHSVTALSMSTTPVNSIVSFSQSAGESALQKVQWLGGRVAQKERELGESDTVSALQRQAAGRQGDTASVVTGEPIYKQHRRELARIQKATAKSANPTKERQVWEALASLEEDMKLLDTLAGQRPQLSALEFTLLSGAVLSAATSPLFLGGHISEFLAPAAAAFTAAIGIGAEYTGKVAVCDGKEIAAATIQCSAEAEGYLANAERAKAITPLCVGIGATSASFALLVPVLLDSVGVANNLQLVTEIYLFCPLISVLAAAVASLALQEARSFATRAVSVGNRRFARSGLVGRTWLSTTEQVNRKSQNVVAKWQTFSWAVLPAPLLGAMVPGALPTKTIVVAALAAAESAFFLAQAEKVLARATDAVALKARSAAVCDTYANQGARSAAILPFTSALSGLCAAATAAVVELPILETLSATPTIPSMILQIITVSTFPALSALFAAAASVSKARCEVDAEAATQAASTIALQYEDNEEDPLLQPFKGVRELIRLTLSNSIKEPLVRFFQSRWNIFSRLFRRQARDDGSRDESGTGATLSPV